MRIRVSGTVQGVGFRPFVYRHALELGLSGHVRNDERGVEIVAEGPGEVVAELMRRLEGQAPPLARVESVAAADEVPTGEAGFHIAESVSGGEAEAPVSADMATCDACLAELRDPLDRRYRYPFINCTDCGPRFTIVTGVPYDRPLTTMADFSMCAECQAEYEDPLDRRFHAQPNACPVCGPRAHLVGAAGESHDGDAIGQAAIALAGGAVLAIKGIGGYHLACDALNGTAVARLRTRKRREEKPFALMAPDLETARKLVELTSDEEGLLCGQERPLVIARRKEGARVVAAVAPGSRDLGVMLPYAPLHHVLLRDFGATLVMTSANVSDEPIAYLDEDARGRLGVIADGFLIHDRPIHMRTDDSIVRAVGSRRPLMLRRSRGYVPQSVGMPIAGSAILGCGAELKSTFCLAKGKRAWPGHHIGDLKNWETLESFREGVAHFERLFAVEPQLIAHDLHPDYLSTRYAQERAEASPALELVGVQHHHAHLAACLAEHGETARALGVIFDGTGFGPDASVWGGELLVGDLEDYERAGMLMPVRLPGGDRAVREPWRMAASWLSLALDAELPPIPRTLREEVEAADWKAVCGIVQTGAGSPVTTSAGRLFDAVSALLGVRTRVSYEGQAAAELEGLADLSERGAYEFSAEGGGKAPLVLDPRPAIRSIVADLDRDEPAPTIAARFHNGLASATAAAAERVCREQSLDLVALSGGVFQNRLLAERTLDALDAASLEALMPVALPPNDGGIAFGQVAVAAARSPGLDPMSGQADVPKAEEDAERSQ
ncbi:MAG: carbamoyltransferase HypF [Actinomycetota bacterium]|nr:carbamoyltransferase HypF [Actinomycetota bacterium]